MTRPPFGAPAGVARNASSVKPSAAVTLVMLSVISFAIVVLSRFARTLGSDGAIHQIDCRYSVHWQGECQAIVRRVKPSRCRPAATSGQFMNNRHRSAER